MKLLREQGSTSQILNIYITDLTSVHGSGLTGITSSTPNLTSYFIRSPDSSPTNIPLRSMTCGTFQASGIVEIHSSKMPGWYQFSVPDTCFQSSGALGITLYGPANMLPVNIEIDLQKVPVNSGAIADKTIGRNLNGGSDGGRTVGQGLNFLRNRWTVVSGVLYVYEQDDVTISWSGNLSSNASADPIIGNDPI